MKTFMCVCLLLTASAAHADELEVRTDAQLELGFVVAVQTYILTDTKTGCQYIQSTYWSGTALVPRMDVYGKQVCK